MPKVRNIAQMSFRKLNFLVSDESINKLDVIRKLTGFVSISEVIRFCISYTYENLKKENKQ